MNIDAISITVRLFKVARPMKGDGLLLKYFHIMKYKMTNPAS